MAIRAAAMDMPLLPPPLARFPRPLDVGPRRILRSHYGRTGTRVIHAELPPADVEFLRDFDSANIVYFQGEIR